MRVTLIDFTGMGRADERWHAADIMLFTKSTRLTMSPGLLDDIKSWPEEKKLEELAYMARTIPSSWEFAHYTFMIEGVSRGFTHQFVRTRTASFAQQTMRVLEMQGWSYETGPTIAGDERARSMYDNCMRSIASHYDQLLKRGVKAEDARGVLPTNIHTNIVAGFNLRTLGDLVRKRSSGRVQGEYRDVLEAMVAATIEVHPWAKMFLLPRNNDALSRIDQLAQKLRGMGLENEGVGLMKDMDILKAEGL